jgi:peptide/nickel transport system ATP-binding protein
MAAPLLEIGNLSIHFQTDYGTVKAISKVNMTVGREEIVGLVGESGCGKTTIARAILGIIPSPPGEIEDGFILFDGRDLLQLEAREIEEDVRGRAITMIPQDPFLSLNPVFTIRTQIMELLFWKLGEKARSAGFSRVIKGVWGYLRPRPREIREEHMAKIVEMFREVQIPDPLLQLNKLPHEISGGQRQRVMIAMALLTNPRLIIADEPTTSLDVTVQAQVIRLLKGLVKRHGTSVLFITHDLGVAHEICDRIIVLYAGQEMEMAPTSHFFGNPSHPYTRKLLESLPNPRGEIKDIPGEVPNLIDPPLGCRFHLRCEYVQDLCRKDRPPACEVAPGHWVRCYNPVFPGEERRTH